MLSIHKKEPAHKELLVRELDYVFGSYA